jgi:hypothetical protein
MGLFKKNDDIPEIPDAPTLPEVNLNNLKNNNSVISAPPVNLPTPSGDSRDSTNREIIKSAIEDSSEKKGDSGVSLTAPPNFQESIEIKQPPKREASKTMADLPLPPKKDILPNLPQYSKTNTSTIPEIPKEEPRVQEEIKAEPVRDLTVKKDFNETIFVRIDKFNSAKKDVDEIERDLRQIQEVVEKIMDVKTKEDEEISELNKNIEEIKLRLGRIDNEIFNRI